MSASEFKSCLDCLNRRPLGTARHLCTLPPECAPAPITDEDADERAFDAARRDEGDSEYLGTSCDVMRRMGALCGPRAALWEAKA